MTAPYRDHSAKGLADSWVTFGLVAFLSIIVAWSLDDASLVLGQGDWTDFLPWAALGGVIAGYLGARLGLNRPVAHLLGALAAVLVVGVMVGSVLAPALDIPGRFQATAGSTVDAVIDFAVRNLPVTQQTGHYLLVLGLLCWANGQFAASAVFRFGRPVGPIVVLGAILVANMSATIHDQIWLLVLFSVTSLALLTRLHALEERATWIRRRIGDPSVVGSLYLRGGTVFIMVAVFLALALTASARSAPLAGFWDGLRPTLIDMSQWLQRIIPQSPDARPFGFPTFGSQVTIGGQWVTSDDDALQINRLPDANGNIDPTRFYWRATTYDKFVLFGWQSTSPSSEDRAQGSSLLDGTGDEIPGTSVRRPEQFRIQPMSSIYKTVFSPIDPDLVDQDVTLNLSGTHGSMQSIGLSQSGAYTVTAEVPVDLDEPGGLTQNRLRAAGTAYPADITTRYLVVPDGTFGPYATDLLKKIEASVQAKAAKAGLPVTPYDLATEIVATLQDPSNFTYSTSIVGLCRNDSSTVECFADHRTGYCEYYASTMVMLLRQAKVPARLVEGFLPGKVDPKTGFEDIRTDGAHAWVEVYFPGYGWQMFDPTGGGIAVAAALPEGSPQPIPSATPHASLNIPSGPPRDPQGRPINPNENIGGTAGQGRGGPGLVIAAMVLLGAAMLMGVLAWRRGPRNRTISPGDAYASMTALARRFGFGPKPNQTAFEYATALGDILPGVRPELHTVAAAKVEVAYGRRDLDEDRLRALRAAYEKLRLAMIGLLFRRGDRRRMR